MINKPKTLEEARGRRYGARSAFGEKGVPYREGGCVEEVWESRGFHQYQCTRKAQPGTLFCKTHDPECIAAKRTAQRVKFEAAWEADKNKRKQAERLRAAEQAILFAADLWRQSPNGHDAALADAVDALRALRE